MKTLLFVIPALLFFTSCGKESEKKEQLSQLKLQELTPSQNELEIDDFQKNENGRLPDTVVSPNQQPAQNRKPVGKDHLSQPDWDKKIIKNASLNLEVKDYQDYYTGLREKVRGLGGYIAQEEQTESEYNIQNSVVIKVPVDQFDNAISLLTLKVEKINEKKITSQDVTSEYIDTRSRIESKKHVRQKYLELLKQAKNMEEILNVQSEINEIQEEIESASDRVEYLTHSASYSTISLTFSQVLDPSARMNEYPGIGTRLGNAFRDGAKWLVDFFIEIVSIWPVFLVIFAGIIFYKKARRQQKKQPA